MSGKKTYLCGVAISAAFFFSVILPCESPAQVRPSDYDYPHNHLQWFTIESEHFLIHYQKGNSRTALEVSAISEEIYGPITSLYNYHPRKKVSIVLKDREDYSNGAAFFFDDKIEIWVPSLDTPLRGTHDWLWNVIPHEFTHIVQMGASMKRSQNIQAFYFQWLSYEDVRRPDVLYGYPKGIITHPVATVAIPGWFAEGAAQYQRSDFSYDFWDTHRDMMLRTRILAGTWLDFAEMGAFTSKTSLERELVYNQGFSFVIYLADRFGENVLADISKAAAESGKNNFNTILETATGISGEKLFKDWIAVKKKEYAAFAENRETEPSIHLESGGFFNFYPQFSSSGTWFAYLTNRERDYGQTVLTLHKNRDHDRPGRQELVFQATKPVLTIDMISSRFSFSPDESRLVYSKARKNRVGETYQDLYVFDIENRDEKQITKNSRLSNPAWHPSRNLVVAVQQEDGTQNLVLADPDAKELKHLTSFESGETVYSPVWNGTGTGVYFSAAGRSSRNIFFIDAEIGHMQPLFTDRIIDYRDPWADPEGKFLYFSSDDTGVFNIYRRRTEDQAIQQLTDVTGGAFMPFAQNDSLYFSEYTAEGYKISAVPLQEFSANTQLSRPESIPDAPLFPPASGLDDQILSRLRDWEKDPPGDEQIFVLSKQQAGETRRWNPYEQTTTGFSFLPIVRFDNYSKLHGNNSSLLWRGKPGLLAENLWRDLKIGTYFSSRDVTENLSIFGGAMIGFGSLPAESAGNFFSPSRLNNLDRDLFLTFEHRGLPFIKRSWSPTISIELYHQKRNVKNGLSIEEFPCTSCLPVTKNTDIRYNIWEANLYLRSKLNRWSLFELGAAYSPYSVITDGFYSEEYKQTIPGSTSEYFRGTTFSASWIAGLIEPGRHSDIAPEGMRGSFTYRFQPGKLLQEFEISDGSLSPVFSSDPNHSLEMISRYGFSISGSSTGMVTSRFFTYLNKPDDFFYLDYAGGLTGLRSYPYFTVGGQTTAFVRASYITPLVRNMNRQLGPYTFDKIFAHLFAETGNGWGGPLQIGRNLKSGIGAELRFAFNSFYLYPMKFFINTTYGFNRFDVNLPDDFITTRGDGRIEFGRELLFYFGLTFDFDLL